MLLVWLPTLCVGGPVIRIPRIRAYPEVVLKTTESDLCCFPVEIVQLFPLIGDVINRAEKEKQQLKIEVEQAKEQLENVVKGKVRNFPQELIHRVE